jgi:formylglycine-generating enzyme required for sulfatase activity
MIRPLRLFISYAHKDNLSRQELETHLSLLKKQGLVKIWSDQAIEPGQEWEQSIHDGLEAAEIILLLISPDFLASEYIYDKELKRAMERHNTGEARVIPAFLRACDWKGASFGKLQGVPDDATPISQWKDRDEAFTRVAQAIRRAVEALRFIPELVVLPAGEFPMGQDDEVAAASEKPQHRVHLAYRLAVGRYPVTFDEWDAYVAEGGYRPDDQGWGRGRRPVINVSWNDAQQYVAWLRGKTGKRYRLLSEAEWEYAARAGTVTRRWWGNEITPHDANYEDCHFNKTTEVGSYPESPFKLCDMMGNVWEWVEDCWNDNYAGAPTNGQVWTMGDCSRRVIRGGSWKNGKNGWWCVRSACRGRGFADHRSSDIGFRVARIV